MWRERDRKKERERGGCSRNLKEARDSAYAGVYSQERNGEEKSEGRGANLA